MKEKNERLIDTKNIAMLIIQFSIASQICSALLQSDNATQHQSVYCVFDNRDKRIDLLTK